MKKMILGLLSFLLILTLSTGVSASEERLILTPRIEGERVRLAIDTANPFPMVLLKPTMERLRLKTEGKRGENDSGIYNCDSRESVSKRLGVGNRCSSFWEA